MENKHTTDQLSKILNHRFWRCANCKSVHRGLGRTYKNDEGDICCDCCHAVITDSLIEEVK